MAPQKNMVWSFPPTKQLALAFSECDVQYPQLHIVVFWWFKWALRIDGGYLIWNPAGEVTQRTSPQNRKYCIWFSEFHGEVDYDVDILDSRGIPCPFSMPTWLTINLFLGSVILDLGTHSRAGIFSILLFGTSQFVRVSLDLSVGWPHLFEGEAKRIP